MNCVLIYVAVVENEAKVEEYFADQRSIEDFGLGAVVFDEESFDGDVIGRDATVRYKIRLRAEQASSLLSEDRSSVGPSTKWFTNYMFPRRPTIGPRGDMFGDDEPGILRL